MNNNKLSIQDIFDIIQDCRRATANMSKSEKDQFLISQFQKHLVEEKVYLNGKTVFRHEWKLSNNSEVCRTTWAAAFGYTVSRIETVSVRLKKNSNAVEMKARPFTDDHIHPYTHAELNEIFSNSENSPIDKICGFTKIICCVIRES
jgi:hypothetical protein